MNHFNEGAIRVIALVQYLGACRCSNKVPYGTIIALMQTDQTLLHQAYKMGVIN